MREAIIALSDEELEAMGYADLVSLCREAGVRDIELLEDHGRGGVAQIEVDQRLDEGQLDTLECVDEWAFVTEKESTYLYLLTVTALELPAEASIDHENLIGACDPTVSERGLLLSLVGNQETIRAMLRHFQDIGVTPELQKLGEYAGRDGSLDVLTDRQLEVISTAYDMGFYEIPRESSTADIAEELDLDPATVSEHLQRAERNLLSEQLIVDNG